MRSIEGIKVAVLHPFLNYYGGAEYMLRVVMSDIVPQADIYTFSYKKNVLAEIGIQESQVRSLLGNGLFSLLYRQMTPIYPSLIDTTELRGYDLVLSFSYAYMHGVVTEYAIPHIAYIQTPMRLLWEGESSHYIYDKIPGVREVYRTILAYQRLWDRQAATRPDYLLSNSKEISDRISRVWGRSSATIYPPVDTDFYAPLKEVKKENYFVTHSRIVRYKRIDCIVEAMKRLGKTLVVIGDGPARKDLEKIARGAKNISFVGHVSHEEKRDILQRARGFLFASHEDFGIAPVEAMAAGTPVLAYGAGGALETVAPESGMFFSEQSARSIEEIFPVFEKFTEKASPQIVMKQAHRFSKQSFVEMMKQKINEYRADFLKNGPPVIV